MEHDNFDSSDNFNEYDNFQTALNYFNIMFDETNENMFPDENGDLVPTFGSIVEIIYKEGDITKIKYRVLININPQNNQRVVATRFCANILNPVKNSGNDEDDENKFNYTD